MAAQQTSARVADEAGNAAGSRRHRRSFWLVAFAFLAVMAFSTVPSPLYGLYRARDHFSVFMVTVIYAVYAIGVIGALLLAGHLSDWYGRRRLLLPALGVAIVSAIVFLASKSLASLLIARLINGIAVGIVASTATAYIAELHAIGRPGTSPKWAQLTASAVNVGGLGVGALVAGLLAQWVPQPLTVPYLVFLAALLLGAVGVGLSPETHEGPTPRPRYRPQRLSVPPGARGQFFAAALSAFMAFAAQGLFTGLAGLFLSVTLHHPSHALVGAVLGVMFGAGVVAQIVTAAWPLTREFEAGLGAMVTGLGAAVLAVWLRPPSLGLFMGAGVLIGAGAGAIFRAAVGTVMSIAPPDRVAESLAGMFLAAFVGISLPVVGVGIILSRHVSPKVTLLGFAIAVSLGIAASAIRLVGHAAAQAGGPPTATGGTASPDGNPARRSIDKPKEPSAA